jgi:hypothetical protein
MGTPRQYSSRRQSIIEALVTEALKIDGTGENLSNVFDNVSDRLLFWDEVVDFPAIHFTAGNETRDYQGGGYRDRFLSVTARCYVNEENAPLALSALLEDLETVLEESANSQITYYDRRGNPQSIQDITIIQIDTDEGVLEPLGVGEVTMVVRY